MRRIVSVLMLVGVTAWTGATVAGQAAQKVEYDVFCKLPDADAKRQAFMAASPDNRAVLVRTQLERWRDANRARLSDKQLSALAELIAVITPDTYTDGPNGEEARVKARSVSESQRPLFTMDEHQAMQPNAPCIAKVKAPVGVAGAS